MDERGIIIADRDGEYRRQLADFFEKAGYAVETTDSTVHVLCSILEKQTPVLLLGSDFDKKVSSAELIHLLKKCNKNLHVIMVSDNMPLAQARQVRQEGIFYHALKPASPGDTQEIGEAVESAFRKEPSSSTHQPPPRGGKPDEGGKDRDTRRSHEVGNCARKGIQKESPVSSAWWIITLAFMVLVTSYFSLLAAERATEGNSSAIWLFLGFCALVVTSQLLPIFHIKLPHFRRAAEKQERDPLDP